MSFIFLGYPDKMPRIYKRDPRSKVHLPVDRGALEKALDAIKRGMSVRKAGEKFGISKSALHRYAKCNQHGGNRPILKVGGQTSLNTDTEKKLVESVIKCSEWGYPLSTFDLRCFVKYYLDREGKSIKKFKDNMPGHEWAVSFLSRHKNKLSQRMCQNIKRSRAGVSHASVNDYFEDLKNTLDGISPDAIINYDETALSDDPGRRKLIFKRGCKYPERVMNESKSNVSVMFAATAAGKLLQPYVIYKATNLYDLWCEGGPPGTQYNRTKSGWIDGNTFLDWFQKVVIPYCRRINGKKVVIGDNLSSHLSPEVIRLCEEHDIAFVFLPANSSHLTQPLDVALFAPLKKSWRKVLEKAKSKSKGNAFDKRYFPKHLKDTIDLMSATMTKDIIAGFNKAGIHPIDKSRVLDMLPPDTDQHHGENESSINDSLTMFLKEMRYTEEAENVKGRKKKLKVPPGRSVTSKDLENNNEEQPSKEDEDVTEINDDSSAEGFERSFDSDPDNFDVEEMEILEGQWVKVQFHYDTGIKVFIGKVLEKLSDDLFQGTFLRRKESKTSNSIYVFPNVPDWSKFEKKDVLAVLGEPSCKRGRYFFDEEV